MGEVAVVSWSGSRPLCYPTLLRNPHPTGLVVALVGHNNGIMDKVPKPSVI